MVSAKKIGWDQIYVCYPFPTDRYTKESAMAKFCPVTKETMKNNGQWYEYTAYEFEGETYYDIIYDESILLSHGFTKDELYNI